MINVHLPRVTYIASLIGGILFLHHTAVWAQEKSANNDTIIVTADKRPSADKGYMAQTSRTGSRTNGSILATPQSVSVIGRQELQDRNVQSTTQALQYTPGVFANTSAISSRFDYFTIRGFDSTLSGILLDGLRSTTALSYVHYQPYGMQSIEVLRGPSGFLYGAGSPGGVVNMISKRPLANGQHEIGAQVGSYGRLQGQFDFTGPLNDDKSLLYRVVGVGRNSDTQFDHVPDDTMYIAPSLTWQPDNNTMLTILASANRDKFGPPRPFKPIYGTLLANPNGKVDRNVYLDGTGLDNYLTQYNLGYQLEHSFNDDLSWHSAARFSSTRTMTQTLSGLSLESDMRTLKRGANQFRIDGKIFATDNNLKTRWNLGALEGTSVAGLAYRHTGEDYYLNSGTASSIDIYHPAQNGGFYAATPLVSTKQNANETGVYLANSIALFQRLNFDLSGRQDWANVNTKNRLRDNETSQTDHRFTWRAGVSYLTDIGVAPFISYATSFSPVLGTNFYGQHYMPTTGKQWETGVKYKPEGLDAMFSLAWFNLKQDNVLVSDPDNSRNSIQIGQVTSKGIEASATANLTEELKLIGSYTWNDLETTQTTTPGAKGKTPTGLPEKMASLWGDYTFSSGPLASLGVGVGVRYVGSTWADTANTIKVPDYTAVDAALRYDLGQVNSRLKGVNLALNANNLFNKQYFVSCSTSSCNTGFDRNLSATLTYRW